MTSEGKFALTGAVMLGVLIVAVLTVLLIQLKNPQRQTSATPANPWVSGAVAGTLAGIRVREIDAATAGVEFSYDLDNTTDTDCRIEKGPSVVVMSRLKSDHSLSSEQEVSLNSSIFAPAKNRTRISLEATHPFIWPSQTDASADAKFRGLVAEEVSDLEGFVLFDQSTHYQIELPGGWQALEQNPDATNRN
jgi:hypothetical protein